MLKFPRPLLFFSSGFLELSLTILEENSKHSSILVCNIFTPKCNRTRCWSRWEHLDRGQYRFQILVRQSFYNVGIKAN